ncbi:CocE/NonD family hydrolase [Mesorhizobium sp. YC-39]|uniref:CocE/NonD family hydrolase n=1 Tax=unclassified Mesorhizobium TaxID=325217 RepID=UPI0021E89A52|nr:MULTISPECIES: CocE/NonD family hydrolase [unclassified Mesorhizobium]MCV3211866.1 CocE/NonD family hydrolase [Mesorhizobium sp. YC-2]MCV3233589.1 CocE/NonD family hydrolase [Mesorhizobium sp. YC-39]
MSNNGETDRISVTQRAVSKDVDVVLPGRVSAGPSATTAVSAQTSLAKARTGPRTVREIENFWIPMSDGTKIAARMWLPEDAEQNPVPVLMEYVPYRKRDSRRLYEETFHPYLASFGYACVCPDIRGSGDSEGLPQDGWVRQEQDDGVEIIAWLAKQIWCTGKVGMFGISWGGYSALQVAARRPPELKAIITVCSTEDRYSEEPYTGGLINEDMFGLAWGARWNAFPARPPDPAIVGDRWRDMWMERLKNVDFYVGDWVSHQHRDAFWKHASVRENYGAFECPVYAVCGWFDPFHRTVPRMLANLKCPRKGLVGPWGHQYPNSGEPGPAIDWLPEALRWWDYWLKDIDTGIMAEPMYRVWMQEEPAMRGVHQTPGRWVAEDTWPSPRIKPRKLYLTKDGLESDAGAEAARLLKPLQTVGITAPGWYLRSVEDAPIDQRVDDARSLTFDSEPLDGDFEILGEPVVTIDLAVDKPVALLSIRLNEVEPDGQSKRITYNVLNLTHRDSDEFPEPLEPGKRYRIRLPLQDCAHVFKSGRRIRVAVSTSHWPSYWPSPEPVVLTVYAGRSELELPVRPPRADDKELKPFGTAFSPEPASGHTVLEDAPEPTRVTEWDAATSKLTIRNAQGDGRSRIDATGTEMWSTESEVKEILEHDPTGAKSEAQYITTFKRGDWDCRVESLLRVSLTKDDFLLVSQIKAFEHDIEIFSKTWHRTIPRMLV